MGIYLSDQDRDCLTNLRFADDVMRNRESGTQDSPRQDENSQQSKQHELRHKNIFKSGK